ncbi:ATP-binding cassette domain-containing protein [Cohnella pontilimi]|uniref:ATP-binding cassette domain-containing protein n=1 Tax=Cohnella pontilimi TaxID=2564100 RepID=A0A4U0FBX3_9BACL|nr:ATP-binding cassette domain-containing protein [Cohnella pontilimi]TJY42211.1 ATP-binding cassette domain-containing protein [Cohnella pontilimi]
MNKDTVLDIQGLSKTYKNNRGIDNITLQVRRGDVYGFFGPNGAGKTTVMKIVTGLVKADRGSVRVFGYDVNEHYEEAMKDVGVLIEKAEAFEYMSGRKNLELAARLYPHLPNTRVDEVLDLVGLSANKKEKVGHYSLGMKQRLGIASAILSKPQLLILDEPTNGLDIEGMVEIRELIRRLAVEEQITFFVSSHLITEMEMICNRIGIIHNGRLIREGDIGELLQESGQSLETYFVQQIRAEREAANHEPAPIQYH